MSATKSLPQRFVTRVRHGELKEAAYLTYYHSYLAARDKVHGTQFAGSQKASDHGGSDAESTGNFPAHPRIVRKLLAHVPRRENKRLVDLGCGSGSVLSAALDVGFQEVVGLELFQQPAQLAAQNNPDPRCVVHCGDMFEQDLGQADVLCLFRPYPHVEGYLHLIEEQYRPTWLVIMNLEDLPPLIPEYRTTFAYRHWLYPNFRGRVLERGQGT